MRKTFIETLLALAQKDKSIYLLNGDLGFSVLEVFEKKFPKRYINCGIAEQNMMGIAAGLALEGKKVYVYSIIPFAVFRCFEQIRNDIAYHNLDVTIIGNGTGFSYGVLGPTHFAVEDVGVMGVLPNMTILSPGDPMEMKQLLVQSHQKKNPTYIRMDKSSNLLHAPNDNIVIGRPSVICNGKDGVLVTTGSYLTTVMNVAKKLSEQGYHLKVIQLHTLKPVDEKALIREIKHQKILFTLEEHKTIGGVGAIVGQIVLQHQLKNITVVSIGAKDIYSPVIGKQDYVRACHGLDEASVYKKVLRHLKKA